MLFLFIGTDMRLQQFIQAALEEDIGHGDVTTDNLLFPNKQCIAKLIAKENGILAGIEIAKHVFQEVDASILFEANLQDGAILQKGMEIAIITGYPANVLKAERVALNFLQRLCGIATQTKTFCEAIKHTNCKLLDTRKTTPMFRRLEKYAVQIGGGYNHRFGLYDMVLIKENHIRAAGSITKAVNQIRTRIQSYKIEVEVTDLKELEEAYQCRADRIMLDNMSLEDMRKAVRNYGSKVELEASGNVNLKTIKSIAETGVHFVSCGALTHSYRSLDLSLLFEE
jgi:nicotinate-nucleotide pyrophosphorylase (carboxylating)